ncbi:unnamed protein product [Caenorhabditis brenneri]
MTFPQDNYASSSPNFKPFLKEFQRKSARCNRISYSTQYFDFLLVIAITFFFFGGIFMVLWTDFFLTASKPDPKKPKNKGQ